MTVCLGRPDAIPYFDMAIYHPGHVPQDHMGRYPPEVWRLVQYLASRMEAASRSPAGVAIKGGEAHHAPRGNLHVFQGRGGAHHAPRGNLHVSQGRGGAHHAPRGNLPVSQGRRGAHHAPQGNLHVSRGRGERIMLPGKTSMFPKVDGERRMFPGDTVVPRADGARKVKEERKML